MNKIHKLLPQRVFATILSIIICIGMLGQQCMAATEAILAQTNIDNMESDIVKKYNLDDAKIVFRISEKWKDGYNAVISIENTTSERIHNWEIVVITPDNIVSIWNAEIVNKNADAYTIKNAGWNRNIEAGDKVEIGISVSSEFNGFPQFELINKTNKVVVSTDYTVEYTIINDWTQGFTGQIIISNLTEEVFEDWRLSFVSESKITNMWNAEISSETDGHYIIEGCNHNKNIEAKGSIIIGFEVNKGTAENNILQPQLTMRGITEATNEDDDKPIVSDEDIDDIEIVLYSNENEFLGDGTFKELLFYAKVDGKVSKVKLYDMNSNTYIDMSDSGNYSLNGDDISGDGIFSAKYSVFASNVDDITYLFKAVINDSIETEVIEVKSYAPLTEEEEENIDFIHDYLRDLFSDNHEVNTVDSPDLLMDGGSYASEYDEKYARYYDSLQYLKDNNLIADFHFEEFEKQFVAEYKSGGSFVIPLISFSDVYEGEEYNPLTFPQMSSPYMGCSIAVINCFEDSAWRNAFYDDFKYNLELYGADVTYNDTLTVFALKTILKDKDIICLGGHGIIHNRKSTLLLKDDRITADKTKYGYQLDFKKGYVVEIWGDHVCYGINGDFIRNAYSKNRLTDSIVYIQSCESMGNEYYGYNDGFAKGFLDVGASNVVGFYNSVKSEYNRNFMASYVFEVLDGNTALDAFNVAREAWGYNDFEYRKPSFFEYLIKKNAFEKMGSTAIPLYSGDTSATLKKSLLNGDFETVESITDDKPYRWECIGDVRILGMVGEVKAHQSRMAFISTGIGASENAVLGGTQGSSMKQKFYNRNSTKVSFIYDFISEEPLEYVGSRYDDQLFVRITDANNQILYTEKLESINTAKWYPVAGVDFDGGDHTAYHTLWKEFSIDISPYQEQYIQIEFVVCDVGDSQYDSAVVIDDVRCTK